MRRLARHLFTRCSASSARLAVAAERGPQRQPWAFAHVPELAWDKLPPALVRHILPEARARAFRWWQWWALELTCLALFAGGMAATAWFAEDAIRLSGGAGAAGGACVLLVCGFFALVPPLALWFRFVNPRVWRFVREVLAENGHCRTCGYDLRATPGRCPECGAVAAAANGGRTPDPY